MGSWWYLDGATFAHTHQRLLVQNGSTIGQYAVTSRLFPMYLSSKLNMIVISVDGRGTGFRGDNFKHAVYRKLGLLETSDQIRAVRYFQKQCYTISQHFAIYGSSYGGYMAGMVGSSGSGVFSTAISQSPVTDWRYYDSIYTERYMGLPSYDDNFEGYENSSLLLRAANLSSVNYMLLHGTSDDNVHFQNTAQLVEVLTKNDIQFRLQEGDEMWYPGRAIIKFLRYQICMTSCTKWWNAERLNFYTDQTHSLSDTRSHLYHLITEFLEESFEK